MIKGHSLQEDLKHLINNEKYSDVVIKCKDDVTIYGCRAILAARSNVFDKLLYNGMMESSQRIINIGEVNSFGMRVIFEFIYTGTINEESLSRENIVEAFYAADYFEISDLQDEVLRHAKNILEREPHDNYSPELLSKVIDNNSNGEDALINLLIETVSLIQLNTIEFGRLSIDALRCLLSRTHERPNNITTNEYEIFRYSAILSAMQVSDEATSYISKRLPTLDDKDDSMVNDGKEIFLPKQEIARELESLARFIDFGLIRGIELTNIIEPLNIVDPNLFFEAYRRKVMLQSSNSNDLNIIRGNPPIRYHFDENDYFWDEATSGSDILIEEQGKVAKINDNDGQHQCVRTSMKLNVETIFEWDIIIEQSCNFAFIGVCTSEGLDFEKFAGEQENAWVLGSSGELFHSGTIIKNYCPPFGDNSIITVHVDMSKTNKNCSFTVNGTRYRAITEWDDLEDFLYPVASICVPAQIRLEPHTLTR